jgi:hypothetical protein
MAFPPYRNIYILPHYGQAEASVMQKHKSQISSLCFSYLISGYNIGFEHNGRRFPS